MAYSPWSRESFESSDSDQLDDASIKSDELDAQIKEKKDEIELKINEYNHNVCAINRVKSKMDGIEGEIKSQVRMLRRLKNVRRARRVSKIETKSVNDRINQVDELIRKLEAQRISLGLSEAGVSSIPAITQSSESQVAGSSTDHIGLPAVLDQGLSAAPSAAAPASPSLSVAPSPAPEEPQRSCAARVALSPSPSPTPEVSASESAREAAAPLPPADHPPVKEELDHRDVRIIDHGDCRSKFEDKVKSAVRRSSRAEDCSLSRLIKWCEDECSSWVPLTLASCQNYIPVTDSIHTCVVIKQLPCPHYGYVLSEREIFGTIFTLNGRLPNNHNGIVAINCSYTGDGLFTGQAWVQYQNYALASATIKFYNGNHFQSSETGYSYGRIIALPARTQCQIKRGNNAYGATRQSEECWNFPPLCGPMQDIIDARQQEQ